ncbi:MAG: hypothetical protein L0Z49_11910, partial [Actinobacteria bacterium]|nr:hypothetical protein [Actinomycetota bacterium]
MADRNGNRTTYAYGTEDRLDRITDPVGLPTTFRYFAGRLQSITDPALRTTRFTHDAEGNLRSITDPDGATRSFAYASGSHLLTGQTSARGHTSAYAYDFAEREHPARCDLQERQPARCRGPHRHRERGRDGGPPRPRRSWPISRAPRSMGGGHGTRYETDAFGRTTEELDAAGRITQTVRDAAGNPTQTTRPNGSVVTRTFDAKGNVLTETEAFNGAKTTFTYDALSQPISVTDPRGHTTTMVRDAEGNPIRITNALGHV